LQITSHNIEMNMTSLTIAVEISQGSKQYNKHL